ncbi:MULTISPECIES: glutamate-5-semialdehyde dehydrogenase [unclassified Aureimonas]|uniref:glutamate-5-semialdehyde dehydrogenase n=1 Tax=unclassified Aureimonas TaxID=2615206 RepID=UPI0006F82A1C|nr:MULTISPECIES: glutamate-5-semialdehyde dehydrogenase [unclassified Aureimonas]KQT65998.1 gamma-glutamyl phosphate reductase [Aureimonas sp. Leaf427]KQT73356.1 gamma-glutamyl phosphate reductase [Aureimonas sp. Leaf460]
MLDKTAEADDTAALMKAMGAKAKVAARRLALAPTEVKDRALRAMADAVERAAPAILSANASDMERARAAGLSPALLDRLLLDEARVAGIASAIREVAALADPVGSLVSQWERPNGLVISRVRTPLGVIGVIYESRPNVTADAAVLCLKAGNAVILRGGSDSSASSGAIHAALVEGLEAAGLPAEAVQFVPVPDRAAVGAMLTGLNGAIDVIVPRGGRSLVARVQEEARVPVFAHLEGLCHLYIDKAADLDMAVRIAVNAKMRRTGVCGSAETLLVDEAVLGTHLAPILDALAAAGCEIRGDERVRAVWPAALPASAEDWETEYLDAIVSVAAVSGVEGAIAHIERYSSHHTEAIVTEDAGTAETFLGSIDSAILLHNASTQFADGGEFGFGGEIGIATGKMHARGPVGVEQLTSFNYRVRGTGQIRP